MNYRKADIKDIPLLVDIRKKQLIDEGIEPNIDIDEELTIYFNNKLADNSLVEWIAEEDNKIIATAAILFIDFPPTYTNKTGRKGYITNMYTEPNFRGKGIATGMLDRLVNEAKERNIHKILLVASKLGRPVYKKYGFQDTDEWLELNL